MARIREQDLVRVLENAKTDTDDGRRIAKALEMIQQVLDDIGEEAIAISFNGGKDCTVLLHLYAAVLYVRHSSNPNDFVPHHTKLDLPKGPPSNGPNGVTSSDETIHRSDTPIDEPLQSPPPLPSDLPISSDNNPNTASPGPSTSRHIHPSTSSIPYPPIKSIYITAPNPFPQLEEFVLSSAELYGMDLYRFGGGMKAALKEYLGCKGGKGVKGMLLGTRKGDPNGDVEPLAPTDPSWPSLIRIHPILDWDYHDVWSFLRNLDVPYCQLYDEGYTSLGSTHNTLPNPLLKNSETKSGYDPAWKLQDGTKERCGRVDTSP